LTPEQVQLLIDNASGEFEALVIRTLYLTGCRVSELVGLRWKHLARGVLTITGKGQKTRQVPIPAALCDVLEPLRGEPGEPIFSRHGEPLSRHDVAYIVRNAAQHAGIDGVTPHWLRHSHAYNALTAGAPIHVVSKTLGHSSLAVTGRYLAALGDSSANYLEETNDNA
jgi:integrase/recombinase XerD